MIGVCRILELASASCTVPPSITMPSSLPGPGALPPSGAVPEPELVDEPPLEELLWELPVWLPLEVELPAPVGCPKTVIGGAPWPGIMIVVRLPIAVSGRMLTSSFVCWK